MTSGWPKGKHRTDENKQAIREGMKTRWLKIREDLDKVRQMEALEK